ncbi:MAG: glycosyltransferase [Rhodothermaceae bacterium]|nr:glycosyltransferase [Rhodothermaceae bacterium]
MRGYKVVIVNPADAMNVNAQNSLLKTLEEPSEKTVLLLVSSQPAILTPTILSRCQDLRFSSPPRDVALDWLGGQGEADWPQLLQWAWGAPLTAVALARSGAAEKGQGLFAGTNFAVNVLLARWLTPEAYGAFTVGFILFLLIGAVHGGWIVEPMLVFGSGRFKAQTRDYLRVLLASHVRFTLAAGGLVLLGAAACVLFGQVLLGQVLLVLVVAQTLILLLWLMRRACYVVFRPNWAAMAGAVYLVLVLVGAFVLERMGWLSGPAGLALMGLGAGITAGGLALWLGIQRGRPERALVRNAHAAHREYGRWAASTGALEWLHNALPFLVLPLFVGLEGSASLRALYNLAMPALHAFAALAVMALPIFVRAREAGRLRPTAMRVGGLLGGLGVAYGMVILTTGHALVDFLYEGQYAVSTAMLVLLAVLPIAAALVGVLMAVLRAQERPKAVFRARAAAAGAAATLGVAATVVLGVVGALLSDLVTLLVEAAMMSGMLRHSSADEVAPVDASTEEGRDDGPMKVLVNAFACMPGEGSEGGVGWGIARELARDHDVWVLTYEASRPHIERELAERPVDGLHVIYHRLPGEAIRYLRGEALRTGFREQAYYYVWQLTAARRIRRLHRTVGFDIGQHVSYVKYWAPSALAWAPFPYVWGPVGGGESTPRAFLSSFGWYGHLYERIRETARALAHLDPLVHRTARRSALALATTPETAARMRRLGAGRVEVESSVALSDDELAHFDAVPTPPEGPIRFLCAGRLLHLKGFAFALDAFAQALAEDADGVLTDAVLEIAGEGPEWERLRAHAAQLGLEERVLFHGRLPREMLLERLAACHVLIHPSFHESGGYVTLEAMAAGRPVLCLALGGPAVQVTPDCGIAVPAASVKQVTADLAEGLLRLAADPETRAHMGAAGRRRVAEHYRWSDLVARRAARYPEVIAGAQPPVTAPGRARVFINAFACGPGEGSERSVGWGMARGVAQQHDVWVLTHESSRPLLEPELAERPVPGLNVIYYRLPWERQKHWLDGAQRTGVWEQLHYYLWQLGAARVARRLHRAIGFDLTHHVSYVRCWSPSAAAWVDAPMLWGPVGGGESAPRAFYGSFGWRARAFEWVRDAARWMARWDPFVRFTTRRADLALAATPASQALMERLGTARDRIRLRPSVALTDTEIDALATVPAPFDGPIRFLSVGRLLHWKGFDVGLRAFARAEAKAEASGDDSFDEATYWIVGQGPEERRLKRLANRLGIRDRVRFLGRVSRGEVFRWLAASHALVHPSFHDSGGFATLEAMAAGRPVLCLNLGGPAMQVDADSGIVIAASSPEQVVADLATAMQHLAIDARARIEIGKHARERAISGFRMDDVVAEVLACYGQLLGTEATPMPSGDGQLGAMPALVDSASSLVV